MREIVNSQNFTKRDAMNSRSGIALQDFDGNSFTIEKVTSAATMRVTDEETGEIKDVSVLKTEDSIYYTSISATIYDTMDELLDILADEGMITVRVDRRKAKSGRDFLTMVVL